MKYIKKYENNRQLIYDESYDYGYVNGVIYHNWYNITNWFTKYGDFVAADIIVKELKDMVDLPIAFLDSINIYDDYRGRGHGNALYDMFEEYALDNGVSCILLISDSDESQVDGFNLDNWYYSKGFEKIGVINGNIAMIKYEF
jgi:GNAT superfamily N-acetyltransferase